MRETLSWHASMAFYYATSDYSSAQVVILGVPFDRTSSFATGARFGPALARIGADNIESYSPYQLRDISEVQVHDAGDIELSFETADTPLGQIASRTAEVVGGGRRLLALGGEHTITAPIVGAVVHRHPGLCVVHLDAHSDLRASFLGERVCHATAMARVLDHIPRERLFQVGIRSFSHAEEIKLPNMFPFEVERPMSQVRETIGGRPVYLTLDVDVLDPGAMPEVQTPQPGGCDYRELARALAALAGLDVVGADIVEFAPRNHQPGVGASVTAELVRELCLLLSSR